MFFTTEVDHSALMNGDPWAADVSVFDRALVESLRRGQVDGHDDVTIAVELAALVHDELQAYGTTSNARLDEAEITLAITALSAVLRRLAITDFSLPYRNFTTFRSFWIRKDAGGSWQARRDILEAQFGPLHHRLQRLEEASLEDLANPVSPRTLTGWPAVDDEIQELRRRFRSSSTPQDYRSVGTHCVGVLEALSRTVYDPARHLRQGESPPPVDKTKQRIGRFVEVALPGAGNEELRGLVNKAIEFAHSVKHSTTPTRRDAGTCADAVILLANLLRRIELEP